MHLSYSLWCSVVTASQVAMWYSLLLGAPRVS